MNPYRHDQPRPMRPDSIDRPRARPLRQVRFEQPPEWGQGRAKTPEEEFLDAVLGEAHRRNPEIKSLGDLPDWVLRGLL